MRRFVLILLAVGVVLWVVLDHPTISGLVDRITRPLFGGKVAVDESEHNRVVAESIPATSDDEDRKVASLKEGMNIWEVRDLFGYPDSIRDVVQDGHPRMRWEYRRIHRTLYIEDNRVVGIVIIR